MSRYLHYNAQPCGMAGNRQGVEPGGMAGNRQGVEPGGMAGNRQGVEPLPYNALKTRTLREL